MEITQIKIIEVGDSTFKVSFMYKQHNLESDLISRKTSLDEVKKIIKDVASAWEDNRAEDNFEKVRGLEELKSLKI